MLNHRTFVKVFLVLFWVAHSSIAQTQEPSNKHNQSRFLFNASFPIEEVDFLKINSIIEDVVNYVVINEPYLTKNSVQILFNTDPQYTDLKQDRIRFEARAGVDSTPWMNAPQKVELILSLSGQKIEAKGPTEEIQEQLKLDASLRLDTNTVQLIATIASQAERSSIAHRGLLNAWKGDVITFLRTLQSDQSFANKSISANLQEAYRKTAQELVVRYDSQFANDPGSEKSLRIVKLANRWDASARRFLGELLIYFNNGIGRDIVARLSILIKTFSPASDEWNLAALRLLERMKTLHTLEELASILNESRSLALEGLSERRGRAKSELLRAQVAVTNETLKPISDDAVRAELEVYVESLKEELLDCEAVEEMFNELIVAPTDAEHNWNNGFVVSFDDVSNLPRALGISGVGLDISTLQVSFAPNAIVLHASVQSQISSELYEAGKILLNERLLLIQKARAEDKEEIKRQIQEHIRFLKDLMQGNEGAIRRFAKESLEEARYILK